jgi:hypothetical protein
MSLITSLFPFLFALSSKTAGSAVGSLQARFECSWARRTAARLEQKVKRLGARGRLLRRVLGAVARRFIGTANESPDFAARNKFPWNPDGAVGVETRTDLWRGGPLAETASSTQEDPETERHELMFWRPRCRHDNVSQGVPARHPEPNCNCPVKLPRSTSSGAIATLKRLRELIDVSIPLFPAISGSRHSEAHLVPAV